MQREFERFFRNALDKRSDEPIQTGGNVARQRNGFALNVHAAARIEISPVRIKPPEISTVFPRRQFMLVRLAGVFDLRNSCAEGVAISASGVDRMAMHVVIGIEDDG